MRAADEYSIPETDSLKKTSEDTNVLLEEFTLVERVARMMSSIQGMYPDYTYLASELSHVLAFDVLGIVLLRHDRRAVRVTICTRDETSLSHWNIQRRQHPLKESMFERMATRPVLLAQEYPDGLDGLPAQCGDALSSYHQLRSTCIVPLRAGERVFGTLELGSSTPATYGTPETQRLVSAIAQMLATAIERVQLGGNTQIQDRQRQALKDISSAIASTLDVSDVLEHIASGVSTALSVASIIVTIDTSTQDLHLAAQAGFNAADLSTCTDKKHILDTRSIIGHAIQHRQPFLSDDIGSDERFPMSHCFLTRLRMRSVLCYPLIADGVVCGALLLCTPAAGGFTPLKVDIVGLFANQAAIALRERQLHEATRQRRHFQEVIEQLEREVQEPLSSEEELRIFTRVRQEVRRTFGVSLSSILKLVGHNLLTKDERAAHLSFEHIQEPQKIAGQVQSVLARADILSELSRLLVQQEQASYGVRDAWLVSDMSNHCIYLNPLAESLCNLHLSDIEQRGASLEQVFGILFSRIRNREEVQQYLQAFIVADVREPRIRCIVAQQTVHHHASPEQSRPLTEVREHRGIDEHQEQTDSSDTYYQFTRHPMYNKQGQLIAYALQVSDITTHVLDEAHKAALLSSVSHHLRTPLTTIKAAVTGLLQKEIPWDEEMRQEMLEDIDVETDHLTVLVNALIEMSRIEMGALVLDKSWCNIEEIVYGAIRKAAHLPANRPVQVNIHLPSPLVHVDYVQLERVMYNLLEYAAQQDTCNTPVSVSVQETDGAASVVQVSVEVLHDGVEECVPKQERVHLFQSFDTFHHSENELKLAICKGIIEAHQGRIWIEDSEDGNMSIAFTLPVYALQAVGHG